LSIAYERMSTFDWKAIDAAVRVEPGAQARLNERDTVCADLFPEKGEAKDRVE
jgi:hypothetical protein